MPMITCTCCSLRLRVAETAVGKRVKCPRCDTRISVEIPAPKVTVAAEVEPEHDEGAGESESTQAVTSVVPSLDTEVDVAPRPKKRKRSRDVADEDWSKPRLGVHLSYASVCLYLGSMCIMLFGLLLVLIGAAIGWRGVVLTFAFFNIIAGLFNLGAMITYVVGQVFGCFAPPRKGARVLAIISAALCGVSILSYLILILGNVAQAPVLSLIGLIVFLPVGLVHLIVYLFYLRALALAVRAGELAVSIRNFMIFVGVTVVAYPIVSVVVMILASLLGAATSMSNVGASPEAMLFAFGLPMLLVMALGGTLMMCGFIWYTRILISLRDALDGAMDEPVSRSPVWVPLFGGAAALFVIDLLGVVIVGYALRPADSMARVNPPPGMQPQPAPMFPQQPPPVFPLPMRPAFPQPPVVPMPNPPVQPAPPAGMPPLARGRRLEAGVKVHEQTIRRDGVPMKVWVYLPEAPTVPKLPCVFVAPAGTPLFIGNGLGDGSYRKEHIPYVKAGFAVAAYELDGDVPDLKRRPIPRCWQPPRRFGRRKRASPTSAPPWIS